MLKGGLVSMAKTQEMINLPVILSKKIDNVLYNLMVRTTTDNVYHGDATLTEILQLIENTFRTKADGKDVEAIQKKLRQFFKDAPEDYQTIVDIVNYINTCEDSMKELKILLGEKVDTDVFNESNQAIIQAINDVKAEFYKRLEDKVSGEDFQKELEAISNSLVDVEKKIRSDMYKNIITKGGDIPPEDLVDNGYWIRIEN